MNRGDRSHRGTSTARPSDMVHGATTNVRPLHRRQPSRLLPSPSRVPPQARAALLAAQSSEKAFGCGAAAPKYESAWAKYSSTTSGAEALWRAAKCYKDVANYGKARDLLNQLRTIAGYRDKAEGELANLNILQQQQQQQVAAKARASPPPAKPAKPKATTDVSQ